MEKNDFSSDAKLLFSAAHINHFKSVTDVDPSALADNGTEFCISDFDGVLAPYGASIAGENLDWLAAAAHTLPRGVAVVSNNTEAANRLILPPKVSIYQGNPRKPWSFKPFPFQLREVMKKHEVSPEKTFAIGDGGTDLLAYKLARVGHISIVNSLGGHRAQELVRQKLYSPVFVPLGASALRLSRSFT